MLKRDRRQYRVMLLTHWSKEMRRVFATAFISALVVSTGISLAVVISVSDAKHAQDKHNAQVGCVRARQRSAVVAEFIRTDAQLRQDQRNLNDTAEAKQIISHLGPPAEIAKLQGESQAIEKNTIDYWSGNYPYTRDGLLPRLAAVDSLTCAGAFR